MARFAMLVLAVFLFSKAHAQFSLAWQKPLGLSRDTMEYDNLTSLQEIDGYHFLGYEVKINGKIYPGLSFVGPDDSIHRFNNFSSNDGLDGYRIVSFVKSAGDTVFALCNDETTTRDGRLVHNPAFMKFTFRNGQLDFLDYYYLNLSDTAGMIDVHLVDGISAGDGAYYMAIAFDKIDQHFVNVYYCKNDRVQTSQSIVNATGVKLWWGDGQNVVLSSETPFSFNGLRKYYQIQVLNENLAPIQIYPETNQYLDSNASDRVVLISYRPAYHLGMVAREVQDLSGTNRLNWFAFNGFPKGTYNRLIGEDKNLLIVENVVHPKEEKVVYNYFYPGSGLNNWVVSTLHRPDLDYDNLILSLENYDGLELVRDTFGKAADDIMERLAAHPELLKNIGAGDIDKRYPATLSYNDDKSVSLYVAYNKPRKSLEKAGIYLSKFTLNTADERLAADYLASKYRRTVFYSAKPIAADDSRKWLLVDVSPDDPLYGQTNLQGAEIKLVSALKPVQNSWFWTGDVKISGKKYHLTKAVLALKN